MCFVIIQPNSRITYQKLGFDISSVSNRFQVWFLCLMMLVVADLLVHFLVPTIQTLHFRRVQDPGSIQQRCQVTHHHSWVHQFLPCED